MRKRHFKGYSSRFVLKQAMLMTLSTTKKYLTAAKSKYDNDFITKGTFVEAFVSIIL